VSDDEPPAAAWRAVTLPLADLRVVAVEQFGAGPFGTMQLADLGADVIKIEDPSVGGDVGRYVPPFAVDGSSLFFESFNRGKRSMVLDLRGADGRRIFEKLVSGADAVFSNLRGDRASKLRLRYADLADVNPRIVCVSLSGFGNTGPRSGEGAYDATIQALAGWMSVTGGPDEPPTKSGLSLVDFAGGYVAAIGLLAAVWRARREDAGGDVDVSLFETALSLLTYMGTWNASRGWVPRRMADSSHQTVIPFQMFPAADGFLVVACASQTLWRKLCAGLGRFELADEKRFADFEARSANRDALVAELRGAFATRTVAEWIETLTAAGVPCAPVNDVEAALADAQADARDSIVEYKHPVLGRVRTVSSPYGADMTRAPVRAPLLGEHHQEDIR
jgi:crotonobetainyl-CoA:carnitine CoA-transferase CaiB-like acyl-CoA transferase